MLKWPSWVFRKHDVYVENEAGLVEKGVARDARGGLPRCSLAMCSCCHMSLPRQQRGKHHPLGRKARAEASGWHSFSLTGLYQRERVKHGEKELPLTIGIAAMPRYKRRAHKRLQENCFVEGMGCTVCMFVCVRKRAGGWVCNTSQWLL